MRRVVEIQFDIGRLKALQQETKSKRTKQAYKKIIIILLEAEKQYDRYN